MTDFWMLIAAAFATGCGLLAYEVWAVRIKLRIACSSFHALTQDSELIARENAMLQMRIALYRDIMRDQLKAQSATAHSEPES